MSVEYLIRIYHYLNRYINIIYLLSLLLLLIFYHYKLWMTTLDLINGSSLNKKYIYIIYQWVNLLERQDDNNTFEF